VLRYYLGDELPFGRRLVVAKVVASGVHVGRTRLALASRRKVDVLQGVTLGRLGRCVALLVGRRGIGSRRLARRLTVRS
jgi:hypothetical protein